MLNTIFNGNMQYSKCL